MKVGDHNITVLIFPHAFPRKHHISHNYLDNLPEIYNVEVIAGSLHLSMVESFMLQNYYVIASAQPDGEIAQNLVSDKEVLSSPEYAELNLYLEGHLLILTSRAYA